MGPFYLLRFNKIIFLVFLISCATSYEGKKEKIYEEEGQASWYGKEYHGQKTSSGEIFNMYGYTAAHRTLPFGTIVEVFCFETQKRVKVKINDRGPFLPKRIIDLSYGAAKDLGIINKGLAKVRIRAYGFFEELKEEKREIFVQVGAFLKEENARSLREKLKKSYPKVFLEKFNEFIRVLIGPFSLEEEVENYYEKLKEEGFNPIIRQF